jgi:hypothetical protein
VVVPDYVTQARKDHELADARAYLDRARREANRKRAR